MFLDLISPSCQFLINVGFNFFLFLALIFYHMLCFYFYIWVITMISSVWSSASGITAFGANN